MQTQKKNNLKIFQTFKMGFLIALILSITVFTIYAQTTLTPITLTRGIYPSTLTYALWKESSTFYAKNSYGAMLSGYESGSSNALTLINAVISSSPDGSTIFLKNAQYPIGNSILDYSKNKITIEGEGANTIISLNDGANVNAFYLTNVNGWNFRNFAIDGNRDGQTSDYRGIFLVNCYDMLIDNVKITNTGYAGIDLETCYRSRITSNYLEHTAGIGVRNSASGRSYDIWIDSNQIYYTELYINSSDYAHGINVAGGGNTTEKCHKIFITNNLVYSTTGQGISIDWGCELTHVENNDISNTGKSGIEFSSAGEGYPYGTENTCIGNRIKSTNHHGIFFEAAKSVCSANVIMWSNWSSICLHGGWDNTVIGNTITQSNDSCIEVAGCIDSTITGNYATSPNYYSRNWYNSTILVYKNEWDDECSGIIISSNRLSNSTDYGILLKDASDYITIIANDLRGTNGYSNAGTGTHNIYEHNQA